MRCNRSGGLTEWSNTSAALAACALLIAVVLVVPLGAQVNPGRTGSPAGPKTVLPANPMALPSTTSSPDGRFANVALVACSTDSSRGALALPKTANGEVKAFARMEIAEHASMNAQMVALLQKLGLTPQPSPMATDLGAKAQAMTSALTGGITGRDFDKTYTDQEIALHQLILSDFDNTLIPGAQNAEMKGLLQSSRARIAMHLLQVQSIQSKLK